MRSSRAAAPTQKPRGLIGWLSGEYDAGKPETPPPGTLEPPDEAVRREMLRLELAALEAEVLARQVEVVTEAATESGEPVHLEELGLADGRRDDAADAADAGDADDDLGADAAHPATPTQRRPIPAPTAPRRRRRGAGAPRRLIRPAGYPPAMPDRLPPPGPSFLREQVLRVGDLTWHAGMSRPSVGPDDWWLAVLWVRDEAGIVSFRDAAPAAGPPPEPPLARLGPAFSGGLSGLILEEAGGCRSASGWSRRPTSRIGRGAVRSRSGPASGGSPLAPRRCLRTSWRARS